MNKRALGIETLAAKVFHAEDIDISYLRIVTEFAAVSLFKKLAIRSNRQNLSNLLLNNRSLGSTSNHGLPVSLRPLHSHLQSQQHSSRENELLRALAIIPLNHFTEVHLHFDQKGYYWL